MPWESRGEFLLVEITLQRLADLHRVRLGNIIERIAMLFARAVADAGRLGQHREQSARARENHISVICAAKFFERRADAHAIAGKLHIAASRERAAHAVGHALRARLVIILLPGRDVGRHHDDDGIGQPENLNERGPVFPPHGPVHERDDRDFVEWGVDVIRAFSDHEIFTGQFLAPDPVLLAQPLRRRAETGISIVEPIAVRAIALEIGLRQPIKFLQGAVIRAAMKSALLQNGIPAKLRQRQDANRVAQIGDQFVSGAEKFLLLFRVALGVTGRQVGRNFNIPIEFLHGGKAADFERF